MEKFKGKYRVESTRLKGYDYSSEGDYFITICANQMQHFFGQIINGEMHLSEIGKLAEKFWLEIPQHFPNAILDEFIIMPNHIHGIILLNPVQTAHCVVSMDKFLSTDSTQSKKSETFLKTDTVHCVAPGNEQTIRLNENIQFNENIQPNENVQSNVNIERNETTQCAVSTGRGKQDMIAIMPKRGSLPVIIGSYKSVVSKNARKIDPEFKWQSKFHDRIIRDNREFINVQNYVRNNPQNWRKDQDIFL